MKKTLFAAFAICAVTFAGAQNKIYKPFRVDLSGGYAFHSNTGRGVVLAIEPRYALNDRIALGLRIEGAVSARTSTAYGEVVSGDAKANLSYLATGDYYFTTTDTRFFAGAGLGMFQTAAASVSSTGGVAEEGLKFGFAPRAGLDFGHERVSVEYNFVGKTGTLNNNYLAIKISFFIGGGKF